MCPAVQDGQDKDACADSFKLVCCEIKIEVNALQKPFCYFLGDNSNILRSVLIHKNFLSLFPSPPYPAKSTPKISFCLWYKVLAKILQIHPSRASHLQYLDTQIWTCVF